MENKKGSGYAGSRGGKGFYIVLFLCAAVIGTSAWILLAGTDVDESMQEAAAVYGDGTLDVSDAVVTMSPSLAAQEAQAAMETQEVSAEAQTEAVDGPAQPAVFSDTVTSYVWPVLGEIDAPYAVQTLRYDNTMADWRTHGGVDIECAMGTAVQAAAGGTVVAVFDDDLLGTTVELDHANGVHTVYANLAALPTVKEGDVVTMGQTIGSVGDTALGETNAASHLHFAVKLDGLSADPMDYLPEQP